MLNCLFFLFIESLHKKIHYNSSREKMQVRGICLDLDDTLWDANEVLHRANATFYAHLLQKYPQAKEMYPTSSCFERRMGELRAIDKAHGHDYTYLRKKVLVECAQHLRIDQASFVDPLFQVFVLERSCPVMYSDVYDALEKLRNVHGFKIGAVTNGNFDMSLFPGPLKDHLLFCMTAEQVGAPKPQSVLFESAMAQLNENISTNEKLHPSQFIHVGDDYKCDIQGAKAVGMRTIYIQHGHEREMSLVPLAEFPDADAFATSFTEVYQIIQHMLQQT